MFGTPVLRYWTSVISCLLLSAATVSADEVDRPRRADNFFLELVDPAQASAGSAAGGWRGEQLCGVYALSYLAQLEHRGAMTPNYIRELVPITERGSSLLDLKCASEIMKMPVRAVRCAPAAFDHLSLPAIAHLEPTDVAPVAHYVVLLRVDRASVTLFDWNLRAITECDRRDFLEAASGYYLIRVHGNRWRDWSVAIVGTILALVLVVQRRLRALPKRKTST